MRFTQKLHRSIALLLVGVFASTVFLAGINPNQAYAKPYSADDIYERSKAWVLARALGECLSDPDGANGLKDITEDDLDEGKWFSAGGGQDDLQKTVGEYAALLAEEDSDNASHDNDAKTECNHVVKPALAALGYGDSSTAQIAILCQMEYERKNGTECVGGSGDLQRSDDDEDLSNDWNEVWERDYLENRINKTDAASSAMRFLIYMWEFQIECGNGEGDGYGRGDDDGFTVSDYNGQNVTDNDQEYQMPWFDFGSNEYMPNQYVSTDEHGSGHDVSISGWGLLTSDDKLQCGTLADRIRGNESAFVEEYEELQDDDTDDGSTTDPADEDEDTCESESGPLAWIMCSSLRVIDSAVGGLSAMIDGLLDIDESTYSNSGVTSAARGMRNIAFIILVPMMLFMVIGTALNFGPFDPYTVKKALPRMFVATIFIALSLPVTTFLVELSNGIGGGLRGFLLATTGSPDSLTEMYSTTGGLLFTSSVVGLSAGAIAGAAFLGTTGALIGILWSFALVTLVALLIGFITLVIRELLIIILMIMAPVAILVWIFPGNDKLWGLWKGTFTAMLLMYPLIALLITSGQVFGGVIGDSQNDFVAFFLKIIAYIMPFFFIPAVFRYGLGVFGNIAGIINDRSRGFFDKQRKKRQERYGFVGNKAGAFATAKRKDVYDRLQSTNSNTDKGWVRRRGAGALARVVGGHDIMAADSARQAAISKEIQDIKNTGDDTEVRALTAYRDASSSTGWKTLAGKEVDESSVKAARRRWGNDAYAQQAALSYEMTKATSEEQARNIAQKYAQVAKNEWGMSDGRLTAAWVGSAFENQNSKLEYKNMRASTTANGTIDTNRGMAMSGGGYDAFVSEVYEKRGSYNMAQMGANTILELQEAYKAADRTLAGVDENGNPATYTPDQLTRARDRKEQIEAISETFMHQYGGVGGDDDAVAQQIAQQAGQGQRAPTRTANTPGAAHVAERVRELASITGVYGAAPTGDYTSPRQRGSADNPREQS